MDNKLQVDIEHTRTPEQIAKDARTGISLQREARYTITINSPHEHSEKNAEQLSKDALLGRNLKFQAFLMAKGIFESIEQEQESLPENNIYITRGGYKWGIKDSPSIKNRLLSLMPNNTVGRTLRTLMDGTKVRCVAPKLDAALEYYMNSQLDRFEA